MVRWLPLFGKKALVGLVLLYGLGVLAGVMDRRVTPGTGLEAVWRLGQTFSRGHAAAAGKGRHLDPTLPWYGDNRQRLNALLDQYGVSSPDYNKHNKPVAVFDWDNTVIKNDIGDATMFWLVKNGKILQPPHKDWRRTSQFLTDAAVKSLQSACGAIANAGEPLPTATHTACANAIVSIYANGVTDGGAKAWDGFHFRRMEPSFAWLAQLLAGYTPSRVNAFADEAADENLAAPIGATQTVGTITGLNGYIRIYDQIRDLIDALEDNGFDVWVVSASPQDVVEPLAARVGIKKHQVIGIRSVVDKGHLTYDLQGCGPVRDGDNTLITYIEGKRCWINKVIYGDHSPNAIHPNSPSKRPVFGAGDSDTDITFLQDATVLKLAINRNRQELMCNAYNNYRGRWIINPMFILPRGRLAAPYPCSTTACRDAAGKGSPCFDEGGNPIRDQVDTVFGP